MATSGTFRILHCDDHLVAIDKPAGFQIHPSVDPAHRLAPSRNCLSLLSRQMGKMVYPIHRLDRATSGAVVFAFDGATAGAVQEQFKAGTVLKSYVAVARGWLKEDGMIDAPLRIEARVFGQDEPVVSVKEARTRYWVIGRMEIPEPVGRYSSARFTLLRAEPETGRQHQIRRHFAHISHPLIGDAMHGDGRQNRFMKEKLGGAHLMLKAHVLEIQHPETGRRLRFVSRRNSHWHRVFDLFGVCPFQPDLRS